ncbi:MAG: hypothetical protein RLZZ540_1840 [Bacteroidota bacterium]|jgi:hypothetical protein
MSLNIEINNLVIERGLKYSIVFFLGETFLKSLSLKFEPI